MKIPTVVFVGTYPPRECGIATFTQDLLNSSKKFLGPDILCKAAAFNVSSLDKYVYPSVVAWEIDQNDIEQHLNLAKTINSDPQITGVIVQHEYGIYGGEEGENILNFIEKCRKPMLITLHTVLPKPSPKMKLITERIVKRANSIVVLTHNSKNILELVYPMSKGKVKVIPHGVHFVKFSTSEVAKKKLKLGDFQILSTFGLLSRGKGIEYVIKALPAVVKKNPDIHYLILGKTHPAVQRHEGEIYRKELNDLVIKLDLKKHVKFYNKYLSLDDLIEFLKATDIYISTSINPDQAVSGTLSYAMGTGRAVVSTEFAQSKEIITSKTGRLVPIKNSKAMSVALNELLADRENLKHMHQKAYEITRSMLWSNVASLYSTLLSESILWPAIKLNHLKKMTDNFGLFQFAQIDTSNKDFGYTIDDNARALIACSWIINKGQKKGVLSLIKIYLNFIEKCQNPDGSFTNYLDYKNKSPTRQNKLEDLEDANARTLWALAEIMKNQIIRKNIRNKARKIFLKALKQIKEQTHLRANAFTIKALVLSKTELPKQQKLIENIIKERAKKLVLAFKKNSTKKNWQWFEDSLNYNNGILPESLFLAGNILDNRSYYKVAKNSLEFLINQTFMDSYYLPIGNQQWYRNGGQRSEYDQQPEDPSSMVLALMTAFQLSGKERYLNLANKCFSWFLGNNSQIKPLYNYKTKGCYDGLTSSGVNLNQGAESLVSYLLARTAISKQL